MAIDFYTWMGNDAPTGGNIYTYSQLVQAAPGSGWSSGDVISSQLMNSVIRQNSLVISALMHSVFDSAATTVDLSLMSTFASIKDAFDKNIVTVNGATISAINATLTDVKNSTNANSTNVETLLKWKTNATTTNPEESANINAVNLNGKPGSYYLNYANIQNKPNITSGTANPTGGNNGDIYIKYV